MKSNYKTIGQYIQIVDNRNVEDKRDNLLGVSVSKYFIKSIANTVGTDFRSYRIVKRNQFTYIPDTSRRGDKIGIALMDKGEEGLVSQAYTVFEIIDENSLLPEYLMMWFRRPEFDRYARYISHGSVREIFSWEDMCNVSLPIPSIEKQRAIVKEYNTVVNRINLNKQLIEKLEATAQAIYKQWFVDFEFPDANGLPYKSNGGEMIDSELGEIPKGWEVGKLGQIIRFSAAKISTGKLDKKNYISTENMIQNKGGVVLTDDMPIMSNVTKFNIDEILISNIRPYFKKIWRAEFAGGCSNDVLCLAPNKDISSLFVYYILEQDKFFDYVMAGSKGTKMPRGDKKWILNYPVIIPNKLRLVEFTHKARIISSMTNSMKNENSSLSTLLTLLLAKLSTIE